MSVFKKGDRFKVKKNDLTGTIEDVCYNPTYGEYDYSVSWDHMLPHHLYSYSERDGLLDWDKIQDSPHSLPKGLTINEVGDVVREGCEHKWVDVGFSYSKMVCKTCNAEQK